jgi:hypothetical protein
LSLHFNCHSFLFPLSVQKSWIVLLISKDFRHKESDVTWLYGPYFPSNTQLSKKSEGNHTLDQSITCSIESVNTLEGGTRVLKSALKRSTSAKNLYFFQHPFTELKSGKPLSASYVEMTTANGASKGLSTSENTLTPSDDTHLAIEEVVGFDFKERRRSITFNPEVKQRVVHCEKRLEWEVEDLSTCAHFVPEEEERQAASACLIYRKSITTPHPCTL